MSAVYKNDGKYLQYHQYSTHTGEHHDVKWVDDLQKATVFHILPSYRLRHTELVGAERMEATETRTVTLVGEPS